MKVFLKILFCIFTMLIITVGEVKSSTVAEKLIHLAADDASIGDIEDALSSKNFEYRKDASVEGGFMVDTEKQYKGWAATQIFSPEIVGEILFMSLGTGSSAERVTEKTVSKTTTVAAQAAKTGTKATEIVIKGFKEHGMNQAITRGFKMSDILKIVREGNAVNAMGRFGPQIRYTLGSNTVVVNAQGKIISVFSNAPGTAKGLGKGYFIPFK